MSDPLRAERPQTVTVALTGNPNAGKTTLFNALTGAHQPAGNYPGVTVELATGRARWETPPGTVVDLPGTYSLTAYSPEETVVRRFLFERSPDVVVDVVDATNLERGLYLAVQLMELGAPLVVALNKTDLARDRGLRIDAPRLARLLGVPVLPTMAPRKEGLPALVARLRRYILEFGPGPHEHRTVDYGPEIEPHLQRLQQQVGAHAPDATRPRWCALQLLEPDEVIPRPLRSLPPETIAALQAEAGRLRRHIETVTGAEMAVALAERRYGFIAGACAEAVTETAAARVSRSERIDRVLLNRWIGLPLFGALLYGMFQLIFGLGEPLARGIESLLARLGAALADRGAPGPASLWSSLLVDGVLGGLGNVLVFLPIILLLFLAIALLEDTGYLARVAFLMDHPMHHLGLHGKSFVPLLMGFGCTVPAVLAARTLETRQGRLTTILVLPLISCAGRLPIYTLIIAAFFPERWRAPALGLVYLLGIGLAALLARVLRLTVLRGEDAAFVMELPPYRLPTLAGLLRHMAERAWQFIRRAGTVIFAVSVLLWALATWPRPDAASRVRPEPAGPRAGLEQSAIGRLGRGLAPVFRPLGFDWEITTALVGALAAREVFIAQLGIVHALGETGPGAATLRETLRARYTPLQGISILLFCLVGLPCLATIAVTKQETGSWSWALGQTAGLLVLGWLLAAGVYQAGRIVSG